MDYQGILWTACATVLWVTSEPTMRLRDTLGLTGGAKNRIVAFLGRAAECAACSGFWISLAVLQSLPAACISAVLADLLYKNTQKLGI